MPHPPNLAFAPSMDAATRRRRGPGFGKLWELPGEAWLGRFGCFNNRVQNVTFGRPLECEGPCLLFEGVA
eukprot:12399513-Karenia_brevis.AAC.1